MLKIIENLKIILILLILISDSRADEFKVNLNKDVSSGYTDVTKSLPGKDYKDYGMQIVSKAEGFPVRHGENSIRFEVRMGDCNPDHTQEKDGWSDCDNDRERHEIKAGSNKDSMKDEEFWFAWSLYLPKDHINLFPLKNALGQFHQRGGSPVFMFEERDEGYKIVRTIGDDDYDDKLLIKTNDMLGKWTDVLINANWSKKEDGFFKLWINDELKYDYKGPTMTGKNVYQKYGVYRTGLTRYINYKNIENLDKCLKNEKFEKSYTKIFSNLKKDKYISHNNSIEIFEKCKKYYDEIIIPTTVVYFDEVRKGKSKKSVIQYN